MEGYPSHSDTWEPRSNVYPETIAEYEKENGCYDYDWKYRCPTCDLPFSSERAVKIHLGKYHKPSKTQDFSHRLADVAVKKRKLELQQQERQTIMCGEEILENVFNFVYLGSVFSADSSQWYASSDVWRWP